MELRQLRYAVLAEQTRSFSRAAQLLGIKQSTLSRSIMLLEKRLGLTLFERSRRGAVPTNTGSRFLKSAGRIVEEVDGMSGAARAMSRGEAGRLAVGFCASLSAGNLRATLFDYARRYQEVDVDTIEHGWERLFYGLQSGTIDVAIITGDLERPGLRMLPLWSERILIAMPEDHPLAATQRIYWKDLRDESFLLSKQDPGPEIEDLLIAKLAEPLHRPTVVTRSLSRENVLNALSARGRVTVIYEASLGAKHPGVVTRTIHDDTGPARIGYAAYWLEDNDNAALARFLKLVGERHPADGSTD